MTIEAAKKLSRSGEDWDIESWAAGKTPPRSIEN